MQEKMNRNRFILLLVLTVATVIVFWWIQPENRLDIDPGIFRVDDLNSISKVELVSDTAVVTLSFDGGQWRVNGSYQADRSMIQVLFATLQQARPMRAVAMLQKDSILRHLEGSGVKVSLFEGHQLKKHFYVGGNTGKTQSFFADPGSGDVYLMTIPGYRVYVSGILEIGENGWRDKFVFGFRWENFKSLEAKFGKNPSDNFKVSMTRQFFGIEGLPKTDTTRLNTFLDDVSLLTVDEYVYKPGLSDSLKAIKPQLEITVTDIGNRIYRLQLYDHGPAGYVFGLIQDTEVAIFDRKKIQPLLKPKSVFREK